MSLFTSTSGVEIYAGLVAARLYVGDMLDPGAAVFLALDDPGASKVLVAVTRYIDAKQWIGAPDAAGGTTLQFPRSGITDSTGAPLSDAAQLAIVVKAVGELCALAAVKPAILSAADTGTNIRRADAGGGAGVEYFNPTSAKLGTATVLPQPAQAYLGAWLATSAGNGGAGADGNSTSDFSSCSEYDRTGPF